MSTSTKATFREQIKAWKESKSFIGENEKSFYFFDWFCQEKALADRARKLMPKAIKFAKRKNIDLDKTRVMFKNNCPIKGELYDDFRIVDLETGNVIWTVSPSSGHRTNFGEAEVWSVDNDFSGPVAKAKVWSELIAAM